MRIFPRIILGVLLLGAVVPASAEQALHDRLVRGEIITDGGYLKKGVWAKMQGVVQAPPEVVWDLFIQADNWKKYRIPHLTDSRAVSAEIANSVASSPQVTDFYREIGGKTFDATASRKKGQTWVNYAFQYYDLPWPVSNKWMVVKTRNDEGRSSEHRYRAEWTKAAGNVRSVDGYIVIEPFDVPQNTLMTYYATSDPGSAVPKFLLKWGLKKTMPATIEAIRREAKRKQGADG